MDFTAVNIRWCMDMLHKKENGIGRHFHTFFHYFYVRDGSGYAIIDGERYELSAHNFYIFNPLVYHEFYAYENLSLYEIKFDVFDVELSKKLQAEGFGK